MIRNILLIQGDGQDAQIVRDVLAKSSERDFRVQWVKSFAQGLEQLALLPERPLNRAHAIAAILVDLSLPDLAGLPIVDRLVAAAPKIPLIVLSSQQDEAVAKKSIAHGAQDFLLKEHLNNYLLPKTLAAVIERASITEALFDEKERAQVTLNSIGDAVISTSSDGCVAYMNMVAERMTGWPLKEALGRPLEEVFRIIHAETRMLISNPMAKATEKNATVALPPACVLIRRDGLESPIEDSSAPIHDRRGKVTGAVMVFHDVGNAQALTRKLAYVAQHDSLTDLPNRSLLLDRLGQALAAAKRHQTTAALLYLDLDRFKPINDSLGHLAGDRLLQSVAQRLTSSVRSSDTVSRLGGDEFVVLLSEVAHAEDAVLCADKILQALRMPHVIDGRELHVTASIGIALYPGDGTEVEALLRNADSAMYEAKERGRNHSQTYRAELNSAVCQRQIFESSLRHAVQRRELELHYQPIMDLNTGAIAGVEALVRWRHPAFGLVLPERFIAIAEESGLIVPIGQWVLGEACRQARQWQTAGIPPLRIAVNVSAVELRSEKFAAGVEQHLDGQRSRSAASRIGTHRDLPDAGLQGDSPRSRRNQGSRRAAGAG